MGYFTSTTFEVGGAGARASPARPTISEIPSSCGNSASRVNLIRRAQNGFAFDFFFKRDGKSFCLTSDELIRAYHTGLIQ